MSNSRLKSYKKRPANIQLNKENSEFVTISSVITKVMKNDVMNHVPTKTNLLIKNSCFRTNTHEMTGKSAGATKAPPLGTSPVVANSLPGANTKPPPPAKSTHTRALPEAVEAPRRTSLGASYRLMRV